MSHPSRNDDQSHSPEDSQEENGELHDSGNGLWALYEKAVKSRDKVQIEALKDDMDGVLIFVCTYHLPLVVSSIFRDFLPTLGWFILRCHHCIRRAQDTGSESRPRGPISLLPATIHSDSRSNITTTRVE